MPLDRFITLNLVQPLRRSLARVEILGFQPSPSVTSLPILMYHSISDDPEPGVRSYYRVCTSPQRFREQMQWLKDNGYQGVTLSAGLAWQNQSGSPGVNSELRPAALTFDDGFRDFYTHAFPALQQQKFLATMYLPTAFIGGERQSFKSRGCLTWAEAKELHRSGIEFGSHTVHHPELIDMAWPDIQSEIADSKAQIENQLGAPVKAFAYPYAFPQTRRDFMNRFRDLLTTSGYETCVTTQVGLHRPGGDPLQIKRLPVNSDDDDKLFQAKVAGGYDWLANGQLAVKALKRLSGRRSGTAN
jgi:peptidoglycan/xylan/chitin deacetylase (PgdA/CDA1 family)